jgi:folate-dependent phosphoribosylglycinamide formyltransferase PurN
MKVTVFTGNQPRHIALINRLASVSEVTYAVVESTTVFPGLVRDFFEKSEVMQRYFSNVMTAERNLFGDLSFSSTRARTLAIKSGDLNSLRRDQLAEALHSDVYLVFGASYIKSWLIDFLLEHKALNIHMGLSPYYRGSSCNFWALYDGKPQYVGATIHMLSRGLDNGPMLYHALPELTEEGPFEFTMRAVEAAQRSLVDRMACNELENYMPQVQDRVAELRYTRNADFTDEVASEFLSREVDNSALKEALASVKRPELLHPFFA